MGIWKGAQPHLIIRKCESNHKEVSPPTYQDGVVRRQEIPSVSGEKGTLAQCSECKLVQPLWKTVERVLKKLKLRLPHDLAVSPLGLYPKEMKAISLSNIWTPMIVAALLFRRYENSLVSHDGWMNEEVVICIYVCITEYYSAMQKKGILLFVTPRMNLETLSSVK